MKQPASRSTVGAIVAAALRPQLGAAVFFSICYNLLLLISPLYMLQVYDRVLTSASLETLLLLTALAIAMYAVYAAADVGRKRQLALMAGTLGAALEVEVFVRGMSPAGSGRRFEAAVQDLGRIQGFLSSGAALMAFDLPFSPLFYLFVFFVHPWLGWLTVVGAVVMLLLAWQTERVSKRPLEEAAASESAASGYLSAISRTYGVVTAMGMTGRLLQRWRRLRHGAAEAMLAAGGTAGVLGASSRSFRQMLQTLILGVAAWLVIRNEISSGAIIASSILSGRALGPIDQAIASWKPALRARQSWGSLDAYLSRVLLPEPETILPRPEAQLRLDDLAVQVPGAPQPLIPPVSVTLPAGTVLAVLGASGAGKSALMQTLAGAWPPGAGAVFLGGRDLHAWPSSDRGLHVGYLPQSVDLLPGTARQNIERFCDGESDPVIAAASVVGAHETILGLPDGYDTAIVPGGPISAGQRQQIGLARAEYGAPPVLLLDEPSASLDQRAVEALRAYLQSIARDRRLAILATHDLRLVEVCSHVLLLERPQPRLLTRDQFARAAQRGTAVSARKRDGASPPVTDLTPSNPAMEAMK